MLGKCSTLELVCEGHSKETADLMAAFLGGSFYCERERKYQEASGRIPSREK